MGHEKMELPPYSNTGVENTKGEGLIACVDWVQATFKKLNYHQVITDILKLKTSDFSETNSGQFGYLSGVRNGNITIYFNGQVGMGVHLVMTGQGCRQYEAMNKRSWQDLFLVITSMEDKFSRIDVAIDDFDGYFKIPHIIRKVKKGELVSPFKKATRIEKIKIEDGSSNGNTIYYGSGQSDIQIRMYEKNHQMEQEKEVEFWNRTEVQLRNGRADMVAMLIAKEEASNDEETVGKVVRGILSNYLRFVNQPKGGGDTNKARWKTSPFWEKFLGGVDRLKLTQVAPERTVEKTAHWIEGQVAPSLAILLKALGEKGVEKFIKEVLKDGEERLKDKDLEMIKRYLMEKEKRSINDNGANIYENI